MAAFPAEWMEELHAQNDIVSLIGEYVPLKPSAGRFWGLCPFHGEKTASFSVSGDKQLYYCFGCHQGGDVIHFIKSIEKTSYIEAIRYLANRANMTLPNQIDDEKLQKEREARELIYKLNRQAAHFYHNALKRSNQALSYLQKRNISFKTMIDFGLGACLNKSDALSMHLLESGHKKEEILLSGLGKQKDGRLYDTFRQRLMFPIIMGNKKIVGFGGRIWTDSNPKYLNSAESLIFDKRRQLYGINVLTLNPSYIILVEGYMDVITLYQHGIFNVVATLGTALTPAQARIIKRYVPKVYLAYDGDVAGQSASVRGLKILGKEGLEVRIIEFSKDIDPDDFVRENGKQAFEDRMKNADSVAIFQLKQMKKAVDLTSQEGKESYAKKASAYIRTLSPIEQELLISQVSKETQYSIEALHKQVEFGPSKEEGTVKNSISSRNIIQKQSVQLPISEERLKLERILISLSTQNDDMRREILSKKNLFKLEAHVCFLQDWEKEDQSSSLNILSQIKEDYIPLITAALSTPVRGDIYQVCRVGLSALVRLTLREERTLLQKEVISSDMVASQRQEYLVKIREIDDMLEENNSNMNIEI